MYDSCYHTVAPTMHCVRIFLHSLLMCARVTSGVGVFKRLDAIKSSSTPQRALNLSISARGRKLVHLDRGSPEYAYINARNRLHPCFPFVRKQERRTPLCVRATADSQPGRYIPQFCLEYTQTYVHIHIYKLISG